MTIHVNIADFGSRLSELVAAAIRGEEVILDQAGAPQVRLTPLAPAATLGAEEKERIVAKRRSAIGMYAHLVGDRDIDVRALKPTEAELDEWEQRKFGPAD